MRRARYEAGKVSELKPDVGKIVKLGEDGGECLLVLHQGVVHAVGSLCPHQNAPLHGAPAYNGEITCMRHFYCFSLKSGDCLTARGYGIPVYEVSVEGDAIFVSDWEYDE